ncbi:hypothetical protein S83_065819, partial [Arachis hypogaea]
LHPKKVQEKFLQERIKIGSKAGALGDFSREKNKRGLRLFRKEKGRVMPTKVSLKYDYIAVNLLKGEQSHPGVKIVVFSEFL